MARWPGAGADGGVVFAVEGAAEPVQGLDRPLATDQGRRWPEGLARVASQAGDAERGDAGQPVCRPGAVTCRSIRYALADVRERQVALAHP